MQSERNSKAAWQKLEETPEEASDQPTGAAFHEAGKIYGGECMDILDWQLSIIHILLLRSVDIRICRSTGSSKIICGEE